MLAPVQRDAPPIRPIEALVEQLRAGGCTVQHLAGGRARWPELLSSPCHSVARAPQPCVRRRDRPSDRSARGTHSRPHTLRHHVHHTRHLQQGLGGLLHQLATLEALLRVAHPLPDPHAL
jgi:hypothetical protein